MGSCFAREIEHALIVRGGNVISIDDSINIPEFKDKDGKIRTTYFHRYTPTSMKQELEWPFDRCVGWSDDALIIESNGQYIDMNYPNFAGPSTLSVALSRRRIAGELVRKLTSADIIILTLGLTEEWRHKPSGLAVNAISGKALAKSSDDYEFISLSYEDVMDALLSIYNTIYHAHETKEFQLFITISPVPFASTFTNDDVVVANMTSKATLRAAAAAFIDHFANVHYFPSYEMVIYSDYGAAWRPDKIHVNGEMVKIVVNSFIETVYKAGAL
jgi:hypothetical protein